LRLTVDVTDVVSTSQGQVRSFVLAVSVTPMPGAQGELAAQPGFLNPHGVGRSCDVVKRGRDVRMCQADAGYWTACRELGR